MSGFVLLTVLDPDAEPREWAVRPENVVAIFEMFDGVYVKTLGDGPMRVEGTVLELMRRVVTCEHGPSPLLEGEFGS